MPCISMGSETPVLPVKALSIKLDGITPFISPMLSESLYSYPDLNEEEEAGIKRLLTDMFVVPLDSRIARYAGYLRRLYRLKTPDSAIAATAMLTKTTLLTRNVDDFRQIDDLKLQEI
jgi:predicted nucleic acid-binding protein